ncbi:hypothetical protein [Spirosoma radiotolerans]|uniref:Uncharacterized protein n=1 Tax=Spirosoma radiotolerans TaxID=1379870 RepID=A0A0E3V7P5_9BACT|nr:hypothetical protein [Spirosoma radiotolerans]AKD56052.1 hypothetical protein SD10_15265 [Spirosoma radiotolerans]
MNYVLFYGWQVGYRKFTSVQLFQDFFQLSMGDAYDRTHSLLSGETFSLPLDDTYSVDEVISQFRAIGALCRPINSPHGTAWE